jgi:hypothetical protein
MRTEAEGIKVTVGIVFEEIYVFMFQINSELSVISQIMKDALKILTVYPEPLVSTRFPGNPLIHPGHSFLPCIGFSILKQPVNVTGQLNNGEFRIVVFKFSVIRIAFQE